MANYTKRINELASVLTPFRYVANIELLTDTQLSAHGYYTGFICPHGHTIRDKTHHWCYECVRKISNNNCGFDINYIDGLYKHRLLSIWSKIPVKDFDECWEAPALTKSRIRFPSYRSAGSKNLAENISAHKVIYQCAWGDVGKMVVTRTCRNKDCLNPLHMISSWNRTFPPVEIQPFHHTFDPSKLMHAADNQLKETPEPIMKARYKQTIEHPLVNKNTPDYDDTQELYYGSYAQEFSS